MLFVTYWELNEEMSVETRQKIALKLTEEGHFPPAGVELIRWDATPDGWGILVTEAESAAAVQDALTLWRAAGRGFFESTRTAPATPVEEAIGSAQEILETLG